MIKLKTSAENNQGIRGLLIELKRAKKQAQKKAIKDGEKIFQLVMQEKATSEALINLVYQESLLELIFFTLDHRKDVTTSINGRKSIEARSKKTEKDRDLVFNWCDKNTDLALQPFHISVEQAAAATKIQQRTTVRNNISMWRKKHNKK